VTTIRDVAQRAGVSAGTVSNVLNRPSYVSDDTRTRVQAAIDELGFVPSGRARQFRPGRMRTLGMVVVDLDPFFVDLALGADAMARELGCAMVITTSGEDTVLEERNLDVLVQQRVQGVLIAPVDEDNPRLEAMLDRGVPVVFLDRKPTIDKCCSVANDDVAGGRLAGRHLVEQGHRLIAYLGDPDARHQMEARFAGFSDMTAECSVEIIREADWSTERGRAAGHALALRPAGERPTAVFASNDSLAFGLVQELVASGIRVPHDIAVVGYDDIVWAAGSTVPLTTIRQQRAELGRTAVQLVMAEMTRPKRHEHEHVLLQPELIVRASTGVVRTG
jgi:LacI family transcriptional regulator